MAIQLPSEAQAHLYVRSLNEIRERLGEVTKLVVRSGTSTANSYDEEAAALHLRKVAELIGFGSLTANKAVYASVHADFAKEWRLRRLFERLDKIHPQFYPRPVTPNRLPDEAGKRRFHFDFVQGGFITRDGLLDLYQQCSQGIHTPNPFGTHAPLAITQAAKAWIPEIEQLLSFHQIRFADSPGLWLGEFRGPDGRAHLYPLTPEPPGTS